MQNDFLFWDAFQLSLKQNWKHFLKSQFQNKTVHLGIKQNISFKWSGSFFIIWICWWIRKNLSFHNSDICCVEAALIFDIYYLNLICALALPGIMAPSLPDVRSLNAVDLNSDGMQAHRDPKYCWHKQSNYEGKTLLTLVIW